MTDQLKYYHEHLPLDPTEVVNLLKNASMTLEYYLSFALAYYRQNNLGSYKALVDAAIHAAQSMHRYEDMEQHQIQIFNSLAGYYIRLAKEEKDKRKVLSYYQEATAAFNEADRIDMEQELSWLGKGIFILEKTAVMTNVEYENVHYHLNYVLGKQPSHISALLGKACIAFDQKDFTTAAILYQKILKLWGSADCPLSVRYALGLCFFNLKNHPMARKCFERVLCLDRNHLDAIIGLAMVDLAEGKRNEAIMKFKMAYNLDKSRVPVLNQLANFFFSRNEYDKADRLGQNGFHFAESDKLKAEAAFILGKTLHVQDQIEEAFRYYQNVEKLYPEHLPSLFSLGQIYLHKGEIPTAIAYFEKILQKRPESKEAIKVLASLYSNNARDYKKTIQYYKTYHELCPDDVEGLIEYASFMEHHDPLESIKLYHAFMNKISDQNLVPPEAYNNLAVLLQEHEKEKSLNEEILSYLLKAMDKCIELSHMNDPLSGHYGQLVLSVQFNLARFWESCYQFPKAQNIYKGILDKDKTFIDCHLRLGLIAMNQGHFSEAADHYKDALDVHENCKEAWTLLGCQQLALKAMTPARKTFERVLSKIDKHDYYSLLALGNIYLQVARHEPKGSKTWEQNLAKAQEFFNKCLMLDTKNFFAVNGMAILCALRGQTNGAREVFLQLRQEENWFLDAWINLGHSYLEEDHYAAALNLYEYCLKKFSSSDGNILSYISKAYYCLGKHHKDAAFFLKAISMLSQALFLTPADQIVRFNMALCQQEYALAVLHRDLSNRSFSDVVRAIHELDLASLAFEVLGDVSWLPSDSNANGSAHSNRLGYDPKVAKQRAKFCQSSKASAQAQYQKQSQEEKQKAEKLEMLRSQREAESAKMKLLEESELKKRQEEEAKIEEQRKVAIIKVKELQTKWQIDREESSTSTSDHDESDVDMDSVYHHQKLNKRNSKKTHRVEDDTVKVDKDKANDEMMDVDPVKEFTKFDEESLVEKTAKESPRNTFNVSISEETEEKDD